MKYNFNFGKIEITGVAELQDISISAEADVEETVTMLKQILPIVKEIKSLNMFQAEKDNKGLCEKLNLARDEKRDTEHELRQARTTAELEKSKLNDKVKELEAKLAEAKAMAKIANK